jgi:ABC-type amino acid transport system permease subunit
MARGDLGESFFFKKKVSELILDRVEPTVALSICTIVLAVILAVPLGIIAAYKRGTWVDRFVMGPLGDGILGTRVRHRVHPHLRLRHPVRLVCRCRGISASARASGASWSASSSRA